MPQFILAFPLTKEISEPLALTETVTLAADATSAIIPGCSVMFKVIRKERVAGLADIFKEHQDISAETAAAIEAHKPRQCAYIYISACVLKKRFCLHLRQSVLCCIAAIA